MDSAGKDGAIKLAMSGVNPPGCQVFSFKHPSAAELEHNARPIVSQILRDTLDSLDMAYPKPSPARIAELAEIRKKLAG
jgi:hypothetical protein